MGYFAGQCIANGLSSDSGFSDTVTVNTAETLCKVTVSDTTDGYVEIGSTESC